METLGGIEFYGLSQMSRPIGGIGGLLGGDPLAGHIGEVGDLGRTRIDGASHLPRP